MQVERQDEVIAFLADPATHAARGPVRQIETHISVVFLAGDRAYKLKRAVRYPYLDFSTVERRRAACEAEVALNRRTAPGLYLGVVPVARAPAGGLALGGEGRPVDWLVAMRRFDEDTLFDRLAERGALSAGLMVGLADEIARFHGAAEIRTDRGGYEGMNWVVENNAASFAEFGPEVFDPARVARLGELSRAALESGRGLLEERRAAGKVRHCHGDLHLRNICLFEGRPTLFDAIEFSEPIACIDVLYDFAFLLMDLVHRGLGVLANRVLNRYLARSADYRGLALLPLFLGLRAGIKAHVSAAAAASQSDTARRGEILAEGRAYLGLALSFFAREPARLVAIGGLSGTGKSTLARALAPGLGGRLGAVVARSDETRKRLVGVAPETRLGPEAYAPEVTRKVYDALAAAAAEALAAGFAAVVDAVYAEPAERAAIEGVARAAGVRFDGIWLEAAREVLEGRLEGRAGDASDATVAVLARQLGYDLGEIRWRRLAADRAEGALLGSARAALGLDG